MKKILLIHAIIFSICSLGYSIHYYAGLHGLIDTDGHALGRDFVEYWIAVQLVAQGQTEHIYNLAIFNRALQNFWGHAVSGLDFRYPPHILLLLWPFKFIAIYSYAYIIWSFLGIFLLGLSCFWRSNIDCIWHWILLMAPAILFNLFAGQTGLLVAAFIVGGFRLMPIFPLWAGIVLALVSFKPQFFILIPFMLLALRQYKTFIAMVVTLFVLIFASSLVFGLQIWVNFLNNTVDIQTHLDSTYIAKMISINSNALLIGLGHSQAAMLQIMVSLCVFTMLMWKLYYNPNIDTDALLMLLAPAIFLVSPYGFVYDMPVMAAAWLYWLARQDGVLNPQQIMAWLLIWYIPFLNDTLFAMKLPFVPIIFMWAFIVQFQKIHRAAPCPINP